MSEHTRICESCYRHTAGCPACVQEMRTFVSPAECSCTCHATGPEASEFWDRLTGLQAALKAVQ